MKKKRKDRVRVFHDFSDDFVESGNQACQIPKDYVWVREDVPGRIVSKIIYALAWIFSIFYCRLWLGVRIKNRSVLKKYRDSGYFLYGNHTQPMGDAFIPALVCGTKHIYTVAGAANLGIPVLGKLLPLMGALPVPEDIAGMRQFLKAIETRIKEKKCVVIYPEAHVWPWYTGVRPFPETSFRFPVDLKAPCFCMTVTYQRRKFVERPRITVYIDGPFFAETSRASDDVPARTRVTINDRPAKSDRAASSSLSRKEQQKRLCEQIHSCMVSRSANSTYEYIRYRRESNAAEESKIQRL